MVNQMDLCRYTMRKAMCDEGLPPESYTAQEALEDSK